MRRSVSLGFAVVLFVGATVGTVGQLVRFHHEVQADRSWELSGHPRPADDGTVTLGPGTVLEPGPDGRLPVTVRWVHRLYDPAAIAVDGGVVYAADEVLDALDLRTGTLLWYAENPTGDRLQSSGGTVIGRAGPGQVRSFSPFEYDLTVQQDTGSIDHLGLAPGAHRPASLTPFAAPRPDDFRVRVGTPGRIVARYPDGRVAWRIVVQEPMFEALRPIEIPGGMVLMASSGDLVVLDDRPGA
ncbi:MAG: hypothetical protein QM747_21250 [Nocardioides sp.]